jgi:hypothetical protein
MDLFAGKQKGLPTPALRFANHTNKNHLTLCVLCGSFFNSAFFVPALSGIEGFSRRRHGDAIRTTTLSLRGLFCRPWQSLCDCLVNIQNRQFPVAIYIAGV